MDKKRASTFNRLEMTDVLSLLALQKVKFQHFLQHLLRQRVRQSWVRRLR